MLQPAITCYITTLLLLPAHEVLDEVAGQEKGPDAGTHCSSNNHAGWRAVDDVGAKVGLVDRVVKLQQQQQGKVGGTVSAIKFRCSVLCAVVQGCGTGLLCKLHCVSMYQVCETSCKLLAVFGLLG